MNSIVILGAGKIARGFIGDLVHRAHLPIVFIEANHELVRLLASRRSYSVRVLGAPEKGSTVTGFEALSFDDEDRTTETIAAADLVFVSVGGRNLPAIAPRLAAAIEGRLRCDRRPLNIITCENWSRPAVLLRDAIARLLPEGLTADFEERVGVAEAVVMRSGIEPTAAELARDPLGVNVSDHWQLPVDRQGLRGSPPEIPEIPGIEAIEGFSGFLERKFFTYNAANATASYLGYLKGYRLLYDAVTDPGVLRLVVATYGESGPALCSKYEMSREAHLPLQRSSIAKLTNPSIIDYVERNARDPLRKLGPDDRLVGPARLCLAHGGRPVALATAIAAAAHYDASGDETAGHLQELLAEGGLDAVLQEVCKIEREDPLRELVLAGERSLVADGLLPSSALRGRE